jgi:hypothetical protein
MSHTPTPWVFKNNHDDPTSNAPSYSVEYGNGITIFDDTAYYPQAPQKDDAAFIVLACNVHDELVALISDLLEWDGAQTINKYQLNLQQPVRERAIAALAAAGGEK